MRRTKLLITVLSLGFAISALTHRLRACVPNTVCYPGGGCWFQCVNARGGGSSNLIGASQLTQCSPDNESSCSGSGTFGVCGVHYSYSGANCDPATIDSSYYEYSYFCTPG